VQRLTWSGRWKSRRAPEFSTSRATTCCLLPRC
jgi:hypothetical protein